MDRFEDLSAFVAVAELKSFAAASRRLGVSASAATRAVAALETRLGVRLLQRTTRSVTPTDAGERYLARARSVLADLAEADEMARAERDEPSGRLSATAPAMFGRLHVGPLMCSFLERYPKASGELMLSDRMVNLVEDGIDLAVRIGTLADSSFVVRKLGSTRRVAVAAPAYLAAHGTPQTPADLAQHRLVRFSALGGVNEWRFAEDGREKRLAIAPRYTTNSADAALWHAERGGGLTVVLAYQAAEAVRAGRLRIVLADFEPAALPIQIVYPASPYVPSKVRAFIDMARETVDWNFVDF
ncbi:MAG: LysR family transcriptional regulator [Telmatospirillum sp.]|nr:LysR family transcriptional regulator [Telmatospirillum sp.]